MTVAITFALTDGAILMTDGRRTNLQTDLVVTDAGVKLHRLTPSISAATYGLEPITRFTLQMLANGAQPDWGPLTYYDWISNILPEAFNLLKPQLSQFVNLTEVETLSGFILGGHHQRQPFIARILYQGDKLITKDIQSTPGYGFVVGGYSCNGHQILLDHISRNPQLKRPLREGLGSSIQEITAIKNSMAAAITDIAAREPGVGGRIAFSIIRRGQPTKTGEMAS